MISPHSFLPTYFGDKPDGTYTLIWTMSKDGTVKRSHWFTDPQKAQAFAMSDVNRDLNVYFGMGLHATGGTAFERHLAKDIVGICSLWADIDVLGPNHTKKNLPPTLEDAQRILDVSLPLEPTVIVSTGGGLQAHWNFVEPWMFDTADERKLGGELVADLIYTIRAHARSMGWDVDATIDLARVFRVPGSYNQKGAIPAPVEILSASGRCYNPSDFEPFLVSRETSGDLFGSLPVTLPTGTTGKDLTTAITVAGITFDPAAEPPFAKFEAICDAEPRFKQSWQRTRKDFSDNSGSTYDYSMATFAIMYAWTDQEIVNLLIAARRKHGDSLKRDDYYFRTLDRARQTAKQSDASDQLEALVAGGGAFTVPEEMQGAPVSSQIHDGDDDEGEASTPEVGTSAMPTHATTPQALETGPVETPEIIREKARQLVSRCLGVEIVQILRFTSEPPQYLVKTVRGAFRLKCVSQLIEERSFRNAVAGGTNFLLPSLKKEWQAIAQGLLLICEDTDVGDESTDHGAVKAWLQGYLDERKPQEYTVESARTRQPYTRDGDCFIFGPDLRRWLKNNLHEDVNPKEMGVLLKAFGCASSTVFVQEEGTDGSAKNSSRSVWKLPRGFGGK